MTDAVAEPAPEAQRPYVRTTGSLSRRMILIAAAWIALLLSGGGFALDRVLTSGHPSDIVDNEAVRQVYLGKNFRM